MSNNFFESLTEMYNDSVNQIDEKHNMGEINKQATEFLFQYLKSEKFKVSDVEYLDGYFIFGRGTNSVINFKVNNCKNWLFGIWWDEDYVILGDLKYIKGTFFCQPEPVDKFKPTRSKYNVEFTIDVNDIIENNHSTSCCDFLEIKDILCFIRKHPIRAWNAQFVDFNTKYIPGVILGYRFYKDKFDNYKRKKFKEYANKKFYNFVNKNIIPWIGRNATIQDWGEGCSPRYEICVELYAEDDFEPGYYDLFIDDEESNYYKSKWDKLEKHLKRLSKILNIYYFSSEQFDPIVTFYKKEVEEK